MKKLIVSLFVLALSVSFLHAQNDTMYVMKAGVVVGKYQVNTQVDSVIFYKPVITPGINILTVQIPAGTFTMGSPDSEPTRATEEVQHQVTLSAFRMSKYEITNSQYATFLNAKGIGSDGIYAGGAYPGKTLISASGGGSDFSLHYSGSQWAPVAGYENHPVFNVSWYGAVEFATYAGGRLPTEAEWEYACRATTTTPFNTGSCLSNTDANYDWTYPVYPCTNAITIPLGKTQAVGTYPANTYGLHDMHGNVWEWCNDWHGAYPTTAQTNPDGPATGSAKVERGGSWADMGLYARSARRSAAAENGSSPYRGIRLVFNK
jgi:sulfatase modifying factor 1